MESAHLPGSVCTVMSGNQDATREACVAWFRHEMDTAIQHITSGTWAAANEISWLGFRDLGLERLPPAPPLPDIPEGLFHAVRDYSPPDPRSRSRGMSGGVSLGRGESRPPPGGRSVTPGPRHRGARKGGIPGISPQPRECQSMDSCPASSGGRGKGAARPVTLQPGSLSGPPNSPVMHLMSDMQVPLLM